MKELPKGVTQETAIALVYNEIMHLGQEFRNFKKEVKESKDEMVTAKEFEPVKKVVYAVTLLILTAVVGAVVALVIRTPP